MDKCFGGCFLEFCSSCKSVMLPKIEKKKTILVCKGCGRKIVKFKANKYKITENVKHRHGDILVVEEEKKKTSEEERKYISDLYGTEMYEFEED